MNSIGSKPSSCFAVLSSARTLVEGTVKNIISRAMIAAATLFDLRIIPTFYFHTSLAATDGDTAATSALRLKSALQSEVKEFQLINQGPDRGQSAGNISP